MSVLKFSMIKTEYLKITPSKGNLYVVQAVIILLLELTCTKSSSQFIKVLLQIQVLHSTMGQKTYAKY